MAHFSYAVLIRFFHFPTLPQKPILHFCGTRGKMNTGKSISIPRGEMVLPVPGRFPKEGRGGLPLAHDLARKV